MLAHFGGILWRWTRLSPGAIQFDNPPSPEANFFERRKNCRKINPALAKFDELISAGCRCGFGILQVQKEQTSSVFSYNGRWIATALCVVSSIQLKLYVAGIRRIQNRIYLLRRLADGIHVIMEAGLDSKVGNPLGYFR